MRVHPKRLIIALLFSCLLCSAIYFTTKRNVTYDGHSPRVEKNNDVNHLQGKNIGKLKAKQDLDNTMLNAMKLPSQNYLDKFINNHQDSIHEEKTIQTTIKSNLTKYLERMFQLHSRAHDVSSDDEMRDFYNKERISEAKFGKVLDINKDWELLSTLFPSPNEDNDRITDQLRLKLNIKKPKTILIWSGDQTNNRDKLVKDNCNIKECIVTRDKKLLRSADTIFFAGTVNLKERHKLSKNQTWVAFQIESAHNYPSVTVSSVLNWTATYRRDSVLNTPYEKFVPSLNVIRLPTKPLKNYANGKTKLVAWFVSNCGGHNQRKTYADELGKHIGVDIYGRCGHLECLRTNKGCFHKLKTQYKFYLAFENSNCKDYITEKLHWNAYLNDVVPIVMGGHPNDYKKLAPPKSYIHVDYFQSPAELAEYLKFLDKHDEYYNSYFLWKGTGEFINTKFMCRLCAMTHLAPHFPMWYADANKWWREKDICIGKNKRYNYASWKGEPEPRSYISQVRYGYERLK